MRKITRRAAVLGLGGLCLSLGLLGSTAASAQVTAPPAASTHHAVVTPIPNPAGMFPVTGTGPGTLPTGNAPSISYNICGNGGGGYCMNDWSGSGNVKMYYGGSSNEQFIGEAIDRCSGADYVKPNCGLASFVETYLEGATTFQIVYLPTNQCVGGSGQTAILTKCNDPGTGTGGGTGTLQIEAGTNGCPSGVGVNNYWSAQGGTSYVLVSGGAIGASLFLGLVDPPNGTCWGGTGWNNI